MRSAEPLLCHLAARSFQVCLHLRGVWHQGDAGCIGMNIRDSYVEQKAGGGVDADGMALRSLRICAVVLPGPRRAGHLADRPVGELSSGEAKRILVARALVHSPAALLFDEPGTALDIQAQRQLQETMRELARQGIAILLVTHYISDIIPEIDRLILLREGQVLADGPKDELLTDKQLEALFGVRVRVGKREDFYHLS